MESRLENCLRSAKIGSNSTESSKKLINDLACILIDNCGTEIDAAIQRFLLRSRSMSLTSSGTQVQTPRLTTNDSNFMQYRLRSIADAIIFEPGFKSIRSRFFKACHRFKPPISRSSSSDIRYMSITNSSGNSDETVLALSAFSFGYSLRSMAAGDLNRHLKCIVDPRLDLKQRLNSLEILSAISPLMLVRNTELSSFIDNLCNLLCEPNLFVGGMQLLNRLLLMKDGKFWVKIVDKLAQIAEFLLNDLTNTSKLQFIDFFLQLIGDNSGIYRHFTLDYQVRIMGSLKLVLKPKSKFLLLSALITPTLTWLRPRLHNKSQRSIIAPSLISIIKEFLVNEPPNQLKIQCFCFCLLIQCMKYDDLLCQLDPLEIVEFIKKVIFVVLKRKKFKRQCTFLLLESSMNQTSATFFIKNLLPTFISLKEPLASKICCNCLKYSNNFNFPCTSLLTRIITGLSSLNVTTFQLTIDIIESLQLHSIHLQPDLQKWTSRLDPKFSSQHTYLLLSFGMTKKATIWNQSFKYFIRSPHLNLIEHSLNFTTLDQKHTINRLLVKFLTFEEEKIEEIDGKWEVSCLLWMIMSQPHLISQLMDYSELNSLLSEQFQKLGQTQQIDFFRRLSMLMVNLDTVVEIHRGFQFTTKLVHVLQISSENKIIIDERLENLTPLLKQWYICGPNEFDIEFKKITDLRLILNGNFVCKRSNHYSNLTFPSKLEENRNNTVEWLKNYFGADYQLDHVTFVEKLIDFMELDENNVDLDKNFVTLEKDEWLSIIVDYGHLLGLINNKRSTLSKLSNIQLPTTLKANRWFLYPILLVAKFDFNLIPKLIDVISKNNNSSLQSTPLELMPKVKKLLNNQPFLPTIQNVPIFHLLSHYTYRNYIGLLNYDQFVEYFILKLILGFDFQALFFVLILEHICEQLTNSTTSIPLRNFFLPNLSNFSFKDAILSCKNWFDDDKIK